MHSFLIYRSNLHMAFFWICFTYFLTAKNPIYRFPINNCISCTFMIEAENGRILWHAFLLACETC
jgi:hypothetical protein